METELFDMQIAVNEDTIHIYHKEEINLAVLEASNISTMSDEYGLNGDVWYFNRLNVPKCLRNKGIATKMMKEFIKIIDDKNIIMICDVNPYGDLNEQQLIEFYKNFGFKETLLKNSDKTLIYQKIGGNTI